MFLSGLWRRILKKRFKLTLLENKKSCQPRQDCVVSVRVLKFPIHFPESLNSKCFLVCQSLQARRPKLCETERTRFKSALLYGQVNLEERSKRKIFFFFLPLCEDLVFHVGCQPLSGAPGNWKRIRLHAGCVEQTCDSNCWENSV